MLQKQKGGDATISPPQRIYKALFTLNFLQPYEEGTPAEKHYAQEQTKKNKPSICWFDPGSNTWNWGSLITWGQGFACVLPGDLEKPIWVPSRHLKPYHEHPTKKTSIHVGRRTTGDEVSGSKPEDYQNHIPAASDASCINSNLGTNRLTQQTERVLEQEKKPVTPYNLALVMFALGVSGHKYTQGHSPVE